MSRARRRPAVLAGNAGASCLLLLLPLAVLVLAVLVSVRWSALVDADLRVTRSAHCAAGSAAALREGAKVLSLIGSPAAVDVVTLAACVALLGLRRRRAALFVLLARLISLAIESLLKLAVGRPRPPAALHLVSAAGTSFPSGHATGTAAVLTALLLLRPTLRRLVLVVVLVVGVSASRVLLAVHYPSDALAGALLGTGTSLCLWVGLTRLESRRRSPPSWQPGVRHAE